jgi:hypothetical protein
LRPSTTRSATQPQAGSNEQGKRQAGDQWTVEERLHDLEGEWGGGWSGALSQDGEILVG